MATGVRKTASVPRRARDSAAEIHAAVLQLLKAIPVDHLDRRVTALEHWAVRVQKDLQKLVTDVGGPVAPRPRRAVARKPVRRTTRRAAPVRRRITHLPVESELVHPGG